jgi:hypothetical protein
VSGKDPPVQQEPLKACRSPLLPAPRRLAERGLNSQTGSFSAKGRARTGDIHDRSASQPQCLRPAPNDPAPKELSLLAHP